MMVIGEKEERLARALSAQSRRDILRLLGDQELTVTMLAAAAQSSVSLTSRHLTFLADIGLVQVRKEKLCKFYSVRLKMVKDLLNAYEAVHRHKTFNSSQKGEENVARILNAAQRRSALRLLSDQEMTVTEVARRNKISISLASRHLKLAHDLGFLRVRKEALNKYYSLTIEPLKRLLLTYDLILKEL